MAPTNFRRKTVNICLIILFFSSSDSGSLQPAAPAIEFPPKDDPTDLRDVLRLRHASGEAQKVNGNTMVSFFIDSSLLNERKRCDTTSLFTASKVTLLHPLHF